MESDYQVGLVILNLNILFSLMFNYMKFFDFVTTIFKNHMFKIGLHIYIHQNSSRCHNLQNKLEFKHKCIKYWIYFIFKSIMLNILMEF